LEPTRFLHLATHGERDIFEIEFGCHLGQTLVQHQHREQAILCIAD
jgi:hypothetical protein